MNNASIIPAIDDLFSQMALTVYALNRDTYVEASVVLRSQPDSIAAARIGCLIERLSSPRITIYVPTLYLLRDVAELQNFRIQKYSICQWDRRSAGHGDRDVSFIDFATSQTAMISPIFPQ